MELLLLISFAKGVCSQFEFLSKVEKYLEFILDPSKSVSDLVCEFTTNSIGGLISKKQEINIEQINENDANLNLDAVDTVTESPEMKLNKKIDDQFKNEIKDADLKEKGEDLVKGLYKIFNKIEENTNQENEENKINLEDLKKVPISKEEQLEVYKILIKVLESKKNNVTEYYKGYKLLKAIRSYYNIFEKNVYFVHYEYSILTSLRAGAQDIVKGIKFYKEDINEYYYVTLNFARQAFFDCVEEYNKYIDTEKDNKKFKVTIRNSENNNYCLDIYFEIESENLKKFQEFLDKKNIVNSVLEPSIKYYEQKIEDLNKITEVNELKKKTPLKTYSDLFKLLLNFAYEFFGKVMSCVLNTLLANITSLLFRQIIDKIVYIIGAAALKLIWYVGKVLYYLCIANNIDVDKVKEKKTEKKREKAELWGKAVGSMYNAVLSVIAMSKRKSKKFYRRRLRN